MPVAARGLSRGSRYAVLRTIPTPAHLRDEEQMWNIQRKAALFIGKYITCECVCTSNPGRDDDERRRLHDWTVKLWRRDDKYNGR